MTVSKPTLGIQNNEAYWLKARIVELAETAIAR
jgi:hypothetical protein